MKIESIAVQAHTFTTRNNDRTNRRPQYQSNGAKLSRRIFPIDSRPSERRLTLLCSFLHIGGGNSVCTLAHIREVKAGVSLIF